MTLPKTLLLKYLPHTHYLSRKTKVIFPNTAHIASVPTGDASAVLPQFPESKNTADTNSRDHNADPCGSTPNDPREPDPILSSEDVLCAICSKIHFRYSVLPGDEYVITVASTVSKFLLNERCPSCRLVAHCINSHTKARSILPQSQISLLAYQGFFDERTGRQGKTTELFLPKRIEIRWCTQARKNEGQICISTRCLIGMLLPVMKGGFSDSTGMAGHRALFDILENNSSTYARSITHTVDVKLLKIWMDSCTGSHSFCGVTKTPIDAKTELRLIDVLEKRLVDATLVEEYIAISYVWGTGNNEVLMKSNMKHLKEEGSLTSTTVPRLVADVMDFATKIGERYLWIDTACIVQDDPGDKQRQLPHMPSIYTNAKFTIVAAVESANDPLTRWNMCHDEVLTPTELIRGLTYTVGEPPLEAALRQTTWNTRGWTFQEALLPKRLLIFTERLIYWSCREESWCEDRHAESHKVKGELRPQTSLFSTNFWNRLRNSKATEITKSCAIDLYAQYAMIYSQRLFSNHSDLVWAFLGILNANKKDFPNGYIWALPYDQLDAALLWLACCEGTQCVVHQYDLSSESRLPIPSWCWLGKGHEIRFLRGISQVKSRVTWLEPVTYWSSGVDTAGGNRELVLSASQSKTEESVVFDYAFLHFTAQTTLLSIKLECSLSDLEPFTANIGNQPAGFETYPFAAAEIFSPSKRAIGQIRVPANMFRNNTQLIGEFVLLSEYKGKDFRVFFNRARRNIRRNGSEEGSHHDRGQDGTGGPRQRRTICHAGKHDQKEKFDIAREKTCWRMHVEDNIYQPALNVMLIERDGTHKIKNFARRVAIAQIDPSAWEKVVTTEKTIVLG